MRGSAEHDALVRHLLEYSVKRGTFTLKSGRVSSWFIDSKQTICRPEGIALIADLALPLIDDDVTAIGGLTLGADPVAYGVAAIGATRGRRLRSFTIRKEAKDHGIEGRLAGPLLPGDRVVVTEDTVTRGTSLLEAARVVRELGAEPVMALAVVDRGGTCAAMAAAEGIRFEALVTAPELGFDYEGG
ncbi:orotate phosphoribosyltransferase [Rhabdothermincola sediminis]|uniref:orotate phosphoribosyltransferase n=1 Tax=Rhabdothermincola sediminis TaxID=2751370 RepID=UPI001AA0A216|nr:orotate phosphoribosyltransferase [Rhabdothermincola sediminis]